MIDVFIVAYVRSLERAFVMFVQWRAPYFARPATRIGHPCRPIGIGQVRAGIPRPDDAAAGLTP